MEKFLYLPKEKQIKIIDAALNCFSKNGYKKASVSDIAAAAGISKAMVFHYFGAKKELYGYLLEYCNEIMMKEIAEKYDYSITDFFDKMKMGTEIKMRILEEHPSILSFYNRVHHEPDPEVQDHRNEALKTRSDLSGKIGFMNMDTTKFKEGVDPKLVLSILTGISENYSNQVNAGRSIEEALHEFYACLQLLRSNLYKEEYL